MGIKRCNFFIALESLCLGLCILGKNKSQIIALEEGGRGSDRAEAESASASRKLALHGPGASAAEIDSHQADRPEEALSQNPSPPPKRT
ncbi:MAG: hypothetical protein ACXWVQ_00595 [Methyloceanibacter sp.]